MDFLTVAVVLLGLAAMVWLAKKSFNREQFMRLLGAVYVGLCCACWAFYFYCMYLIETHRARPWLVEVNRQGPGVLFVWATAWTDDQVLKVIIDIVVGAVILCLVPGVLTVGRYLVGFVLALAFGGTFLSLYRLIIMRLASESTTGMVVAVILAVGPPRSLFGGWPPAPDSSELRGVLCNRSTASSLIGGCLRYSCGRRRENHG